MLFLALSLALVAGNRSPAPLLTSRETIDRVVNGVQERSYIVMFNTKAPQFEFQAHDKLKSWLPSVMPAVNPENVQHVYHLDDGFRGFAVWANSKALESIRSYQGVRYVEEDQVMRATADFTTRPDWGQVRVAQPVRNLNNTGGYYNPTNYAPGSADTDAWNWVDSVYQGYHLINDGHNAKVWIVDTGVWQSHQEFLLPDGKTSRVSTNQDYVLNSNGGTDCNGHGTHCAGSAAGNYRGLARAADIGNVRVLNCQGSGTSANVVAGFNFVGVNRDKTKAGNIMSASLGGGKSAASEDAINSLALNYTVIPIVAAGNDNQNACNYSPAGAKEAITVGATQSSDTRSTFSNFGPCVDVFSPGQNIHSSWYNGNNVYNTISGTSMATPLVSGAVALYVTLVGGVDAVTAAKVSQEIIDTAVYGVVVNPGNESPNRFINANWNKV